MTLEHFFQVLCLTDGWRIYRPLSMLRRFGPTRQCPVTAVASELGYGEYDIEEADKAGRKLGLPGDVVADLLEAADGVMKTPRQWDMRIKLLEACKLKEN